MLFRPGVVWGTRDVILDYPTRKENARAGHDYTATNGTLSFRPGETRKTVRVTLIDDAVRERVIYDRIELDRWMAKQRRRSTGVRGRS